MFCCPHCSTLSTLSSCIVTPDSRSTILWILLTTLNKQCGQLNIPHSCFRQFWRVVVCHVAHVSSTVLLSIIRKFYDLRYFISWNNKDVNRVKIFAPGKWSLSWFLRSVVHALSTVRSMYMWSANFSHSTYTKVKPKIAHIEEAMNTNIIFWLTSHCSFTFRHLWLFPLVFSLQQLHANTVRQFSPVMQILNEYMNMYSSLLIYFNKIFP